MTEHADGSPRSASPTVSARSFVTAHAFWLDRRDHLGRGRRVPPPSADGLAAARGRDAGALRRPRQPRRRARARHTRARRRPAPLPLRLGRRAPRVRARRHAHRLGGVRGREPAARRPARAATGRSQNRPDRDGAGREQLGVPLSRCLRAHVQPLPVPLAPLVHPPASRPRPARVVDLGSLGSRHPARRRVAPVRRARPRIPGGVRARRATGGAPPGSRRVRRRRCRRNPVLDHRSRSREPVRRRRRRPRLEARRARGRS